MSSSREPKILIAFGGVLLAESVAALIWAGAAAERLANLERYVEQNRQIIERTVRLEVQTDHIRHTLVRIEAKLDKKVEQDDHAYASR